MTRETYDNTNNKHFSRVIRVVSEWTTVRQYLASHYSCHKTERFISFFAFTSSFLILEYQRLFYVFLSRLRMDDEFCLLKASYRRDFIERGRERSTHSTAYICIVCFFHGQSYEISARTVINQDFLRAFNHFSGMNFIKLYTI